MGALFSQLILNRRSTGNRYSGRLKPSQPFCRFVNSARPAMLGNMPLIGPGLPLANFAMGWTDGTPLYHWQVPSTGFTYRKCLPEVRRFLPNCRSTPILTYAC